MLGQSWEAWVLIFYDQLVLWLWKNNLNSVGFSFPICDINGLDQIMPKVTSIVKALKWTRISISIYLYVYLSVILFLAFFFTKIPDKDLFLHD